jgi:hypothetical protein
MSDFRYKALSHVWGPENPTRDIRLNVKTERVRENLWLALRYLRHSDKTRVLWVDAIFSYVDRHQTKYRGNLRLGPRFLKGLRFALFLNNIIPSRLWYAHNNHRSATAP